MKENNYQLVVIGGGISGLGFAHLARKHAISTLVLEARNKIGGCINSHRFNTENGSYWAELGAHTCYNSYGNLLQMLEDTGQLATLQAKEKLSYQIYTGEGLSSIFSQLVKSELIGVLPRLWSSKKAGRSVRDYYGSVIGAKNFSKVLGPALDAVVCQSSGDFPAESLFIKKPRRKEVMRSFTGPEGIQSFVDGIADQPGMEIRKDSPVREVERSEDGYVIYPVDGEPLHATSLVVATAPDIAAGLLRHAFPELAEMLAEIKMVDIESESVLFSKNKLKLPPVAGIIGREEAFYSAVSRDLVPDSGYRAFTFHFRPALLGRQEKIDCICKVLGVQETDILGHASMVNRLPALRQGHGQWVERLQQGLSGHDLGLTGNWFSGVSIEDSLVRTADEFQRLFRLK